MSETLGIKRKKKEPVTSQKKAKKEEDEVHYYYESPFDKGFEKDFGVPISSKNLLNDRTLVGDYDIVYHCGVRSEVHRANLPGCNLKLKLVENSKKMNIFRGKILFPEEGLPELPADAFQESHPIKQVGQRRRKGQ